MPARQIIADAQGLLPIRFTGGKTLSIKPRLHKTADVSIGPLPWSANRPSEELDRVHFQHVGQLPDDLLSADLTFLVLLLLIQLVRSVIIRDLADVLYP